MPEDPEEMRVKRLEFIKPVMLVLLIAALLVFIKVLPDLPAIADTTEEFREDTHAVIEAPPLPETDTSSVGFTNPSMFEPGPDVSPDDQNVTPADLEPSNRSKTIAGIVDAMIYILIAVIGGFGIYLLFKYRRRMTLKAMFGSLLMIVSIATCTFFGYMIYRMVYYQTDIDIGEYQLGAILIVLSAPVGFYISYSIFSRKAGMKHRNFALLLVGALMGSFLAALLPLYGVIPLAVAISLFDIYSVRQGPIRKIMTLADGEEGTPAKPVAPIEAQKPVHEPVPMPDVKPAPTPEEPKQQVKKVVSKPEEYDDDSDVMLMYEASEWSIGIGDFVIYSMFASFVLTHTLQFLPYYGFYTPELGFVLPWLIFLITISGLLIGFTATIKLLSKESLMPGLPLAIFFGLALFLGTLAVMQVINFLAYGKFAPIV